MVDVASWLKWLDRGDEEQVMSMVGKHPIGIPRRVQWDNIRGRLGHGQSVMEVAKDPVRWMDFVSSRCTCILLKLY
jgi:hypothetical protein